MNKKIILTVIDGLGLRDQKQGNAFKLANTPTFDKLLSEYPNSVLQASGTYVGLPENQIGNSEVGHLSIGAGRIVYTGLSLINNQLKSKEFFRNKVLLEMINEVQNSSKTLHVMGMLSNGGVHSLDEHMFNVLKMCFEHNLKNVSIHIFGDGRDTKPQYIKHSLNALINLSKKYNYPISSISGRFYAMDRDKIFARNQVAYDALLGKSQNSYEDINNYIDTQYNKGIYDEFFEPAIYTNGKFIKDNDVILFTNFRPDRARQLTSLFIGSEIYDYKPANSLKNISFYSMMKYEGLNTKVVFEEMKVINPIGEVLERNNLKQLRIAETQKYAHVTFFMDGGKDIVYRNEKRILIDSLKVESFASAPQMSAKQITDSLLENILDTDFVIMNYANCDMVGHTGNLQATIKAIEFLDSQFARILDFVSKHPEITWFITADHGNAELTEDSECKPAKKHTINPVFFISSDKHISLKNGSLCDVAPTILDYLKISKPSEMTSKSLLKKIKLEA